MKIFMKPQAIFYFEFLDTSVEFMIAAKTKVMYPTSNNLNVRPYSHRARALPLGNRYGTYLQAASLAATLAASLGVNGPIEINVFLSKRFR